MGAPEWEAVLEEIHRSLPLVRPAARTDGGGGGRGLARGGGMGAPQGRTDSLVPCEGGRSPAEPWDSDHDPFSIATPDHDPVSFWSSFRACPLVILPPPRRRARRCRPAPLPPPSAAPVRSGRPPPAGGVLRHGPQRPRQDPRGAPAAAGPGAGGQGDGPEAHLKGHSPGARDRLEGANSCPLPFAAVSAKADRRSHSTTM